MTKLSKFTYTPKQKYVYPATSSQEFGWYSDEVIEAMVFSGI